MRQPRIHGYLLIILFLVATLPLLLVGAGQSLRLRQSIRAAQAEQIDQAERVSGRVRDYVIERHSRAVRHLTSQLGSLGDLGDFDLQQILDLFREEYPGIVATYIADRSGDALAFSPPRDHAGRPLAGQNPSGQKANYERLVMTRQLIYTSVFSASVIQGEPLVTIAAPVLDAEGEVIYFLAAGLNLGMMAEVIGQERQFSGESILLVDGQNTLIAHAGPGEYLPLSNLSGNPFVEAMRSDVRWEQRQRVVASYSLIPELGWGVVVATPASEFYGPLREAVAGVLITVVLALVIGWLLAWCIARAMNAPIARLAEAAARIRSGDLMTRVQLHGRLIPRELADLGATFDRMIDSLRQHQEEQERLKTGLEDRVQERTAELTRRGQQLAVLQQTASAVAGVLELPSLMQVVADGILQLVNADLGLVLLNGTEGEPIINCACAVGVTCSTPNCRDLMNGPCGEVFRSGRPVVIHRLDPDSEVPRGWLGFAAGGSFCAVPMQAGGEVVGTLCAIGLRPHQFGQDSLDLLGTLSGQVGPAASAARLFAEVKDHRNRLQAITDSMRDGLLLVDDQNRVQFANPAAIHLLQVKRPVLETGLVEWFSSWNYGKPGTIIHPPRESAGGSAISVMDLEFPGPPRRVVASTVFPVVGGGSSYTGYGLLLRDVTSERETDQYKDELIANVSHELRTPLTTILGNAATLQNLASQMGPAEQAEFVEGILLESRRLRDLIEGLLDMSRISTGALTLDKDIQPWAPVLARSVARAGQRWPGHSFRLQVEPELPLVNVDAPRAEQVLDNLLANAARYAPEGTEVVIRAGSAGSWVLTAVVDQGIGIPEADLERIFDRFYRGQQAEVRRSSGAGLGLSICRGIVESHGGSIWAERNSGPGATIRFTLPAVWPDGEGGPEDVQD